MLFLIVSGGLRSNKLEQLEFKLEKNKKHAGKVRKAPYCRKNCFYHDPLALKPQITMRPTIPKLN